MRRGEVDIRSKRARRVALPIAALAALCLAACSGGGTPVAKGHSHRGKTTTTTTTAPATTTTQTLNPGGVGVSSCMTSQVSVTPSTANGAAGTQVQRFIVANTSNTTCQVQSYPFVSLFGPQPQGNSNVEANLSVSQQVMPSSFGDLGQAGGPLKLSPGGSAVFFIRWSDVPTGAAACPTADGFDFRTPQAGSSDQRLIYFTFQAPICGTVFYVSQMLSDSVTS